MVGHPLHPCPHFDTFCLDTHQTQRDKKSNNIGVITTADTKENGVLLLQALLSSETVAIHKAPFSVGTTAWNSKDGTNSIDRFKLRVAELHTQLIRFKKVIKAAKDIFGTDKISYSGKDGVHQDDL
jgi:hypothetical protein